MVLFARKVTVFWLILLFAVALSACNATPSPTPPPPTPAVATIDMPAPKITAPTPTVTTSSSAAPAALKAEAGDTVIKLTWSAVPNAPGYFVFRDGNVRPLTPKPINTTMFDDIGLTNGRTYTYTLAVANADGQPGPQSAPITAMPKSR